MFLGEGALALVTAEALESVTVLAELLTEGLAVVTRHFEPCLSESNASQ